MKPWLLLLVSAALSILLTSLGTVVAAAQQGPAQWQPSLDEHPWPEMSIAALLESIPAQPLRTPADNVSTLRLATLYWYLGRYDEATSLLTPLWMGASNDEVGVAVGVLWPLIWADIERGKKEWVSSVNQLALANERLKDRMSAEQWAALARLVKMRQFDLALSLAPMAAQMDLEFPTDDRRVQYSRDALVMILLALRPDSLVLDKSGRSSIAPEKLEALPQLRPWGAALLHRAEMLSDELDELDQTVLANTELAAAVLQTRDATLQAARGQPGAAMSRHRAAAATLRRLGRSDLRAQALAGLVADALALGTREALESAYEGGEELIALHEQRMARMGTAGSHYQVRQGEDYRSMRQLLQKLIDDPKTPAEETTLFSQQLVLLADQLQLRPVRRQMALLRTLGRDTDSRNQLGVQINQAKSALAQNAVALREAQQRGLAREDMRSGNVEQILDILKRPTKGQTIQFEAGSVSAGQPMTAEAGPYVELQSARKVIRRLMDAGVRTSLDGAGAAELPSNWSALVDGMGAQDAIVMFMDAPADQPLRAAVISAAAPPRIVVLPEAKQPDLSQLVRGATASLAANTPGAMPVLEKLGRMLWLPLGPLPARLTIVPNLVLVGLPFEALPVGDGRTVSSSHSVRYAMGLGNGAGRHIGIASPTAALVLGATNFQRQRLAPLADAGIEVNDVRSMLRKAKFRLEPSMALPADGKSLLNRAPGMTFIHVATHSMTDRVDPMFDGLAFPDADLLAIEMATSSLRADLAVFSACGLFSNRGQGTQPVSGLATTTLAVVAPQIVTTLWSVESHGTRLFMTAFYERLLTDREPAAALVNTKRLFQDSKQLQDWADSHGEAVDTVRLSAPYYWAGFVLAVRGSK